MCYQCFFNRATISLTTVCISLCESALRKNKTFSPSFFSRIYFVLVFLFVWSGTTLIHDGGVTAVQLDCAAWFSGRCFSCAGRNSIRKQLERQVNFQKLSSLRSGQWHPEGKSCEGGVCWCTLGRVFLCALKAEYLLTTSLLLHCICISFFAFVSFLLERIASTSFFPATLVGWLVGWLDS